MGMFTLAIFVNFTVLPGLAAMFDWDLPTLNNNISEEEVKITLPISTKNIHQNPTNHQITYNKDIVLETKTLPLFKRTIL